jgi:GNAT superfamily N-acetyltransferase
LSDWRTPEEIADQDDRPLKLRIRPQAEDVERMLNDGQSIALLVRVDDENEQEIGRAEMTLEIAEQSDPLTGQTERYRRARLDGFTITKLGQGRGVEPLLLKRVEALAREHGVREVYGELEIGDVRHFFEQGGYQVRRTPPGRDKVSKPLGPG